jgi:ethanolamine permease
VLDGLAVLPGAVALAVFLFMGFEWVTPLGLRPQAYARKVPWSMPVAIGALTLSYAAFMVGAAATLPAATLAGSTTPQVAYLRELLGSVGLPLAAMLSLSAIVSTFNAGLMGGSRLVLILSREGHLPRWCGTMSLRTGAPVGAVLMLAGLATVAAVTVRGLRMELVVAVIGAAVICVIYAGYVAAAVRLRQTEPDRPRPFSSPVPRRGQMTVAAILPLLGVATLFSLPEHLVAPSLIIVACLALAVTLSGWSLRRQTAGTATGHRAVDARPEVASR